MASNINLL